VQGQDFEKEYTVAWHQQ